jgi:hypothetical protein
MGKMAASRSFVPSIEVRAGAAILSLPQVPEMAR